MSMFGNLFDEGGNENDDDDEFVSSAGGESAAAKREAKPASGASKPPAPRPDHGLCGIFNRGATCYLNSLLQTLSMTPEFCTRLFQLGTEELGCLSDRDIPGSKVRVIPLELQRLFGRLLLLNVAAVSTAELTSSFGWNNHEERDQHDIQELNRILFSAMDESLVGTAGQSLIHDLYHGKMTNTIECGCCGAVSERDEDFLDLCVSVSGSSTLQDSLARMFLDTEILDASNQYRCDSCGRLADATKTTRLRHVPPVLTVSLLRFNYDPVKMERYKETGHFEFPPRLDMSAFCSEDANAAGGKTMLSSGKPGELTGSGECRGDHRPVMNGFDHGEKLGGGSACGDSPDPETKATTFSCTYELFSVVVHRGGAHGGHYHALIRDLDARGCWTEPEAATKEDTAVTSIPDKSPTAPCSNGIVTEDLDLTSPWSVVAAILLQSGGAISGMSVGELAEKIISATGESWKKKYKTRHGSLTKFLSDNGDLFVHDAVNGWVTLAPGADLLQVQKKPESEEKVKETNEVAPAPVPAQDPAKPTKKKAAAAVRSEKLNVCSPRSVITCILRDAGEAGLSVTDMCSKISDVTGDSWRKRFKPKHGSFVKFLTDNSDRFVHDVSGGWVSLVAAPRSFELIGDVADVNGSQEENNSSSSEVVQHEDVSSTVTVPKPSGKQRKKRSKLKPPSVQEGTVTLRENKYQCQEVASVPSEDTPSTPGHCWFDFNDTTVRPIPAEDVRKHFVGKECAYMLFYRAVPAAESNCGSEPVEIPGWLISEIAAENEQLERQRAEYEDLVNVVPVEIHFGCSYEYHESVLRPHVGACYFVEQTVDLRTDSNLLLQAVGEVGGELVERCHTIHIAKSLPYGGLHLYQEVTADPTASLKSSGVVHGSKLFVWNGREVQGMAVPVGYENEPITLKFEVEKSRETVTVNVAKNMTILALRGLVASRLQVHNAEKIQLCRPNAAESGLVPLDLSRTANEAGLRAKDKIVVRHLGLRTAAHSSPSSPVSPSATRNILPRNISVCCESHVGNDVFVVEVEVESAASVEELKVLVMTSADVPIEMISEVRLRLRLDDLGLGGLGPPLYESIDLATTCLTDGATLVLESGQAPRDTEITLTVSASASNELELTVDRDMPIHQLLHQILMLAGTAVQGDEWHLCRSDWTGDAAGPVLSDPNKTVGDAGLNHGDHLYLRPGCPAPPGFIKVFIHPMSSPTRVCWWDREKGPAAAATVRPDPVGSVVISKLSTLAELKQQVMTILPDAGVPSPPFLRLQTLTLKLRPAAILRQHAQILSKMKIGDGCALGVEVLPSEEDLGPEQTVLVVKRRLPGERSYADCAQEVVWDTSQGATITSLRKTVAKTIGETDTCIRMAKHIPDKFEWIVIPHANTSASRSEDPTFCTVGGGKKKRKRKGNNAKSASGGGGGSSSGCNLKSAPFHIQDGDVIGVKIADEPSGEDSDFGSAEDDLGKKSIRSRQSEAAALSEARKKSEAKSPTSSDCRRAEAAIKIHVDNFR